MKKRMASFLIGFLIAGFALSGTAPAQTSDKAAVMAAVTRFYEALNVMFTGDIEPMKAVWSHADDVTYMGPGGGLQYSWGAVLAEWEKQAAMKLGGSVTPQDMRVMMGRDLAVVQNYEIGTNTDAEGNPQQVSIRATNIFRKENGAWKMTGHHTDLLPYLS